jgi:hypothetical protein
MVCRAISTCVNTCTHEATAASDSLSVPSSSIKRSRQQQEQQQHCTLTCTSTGSSVPAALTTGGVLGRLAAAALPVARPAGGPSYTHAGVLMGLGLTGAAAQLSWADVYRFEGGGMYAGGSMCALEGVVLRKGWGCCLMTPRFGGVEKRISV